MNYAIRNTIFGLAFSASLLVAAKRMHVSGGPPTPVGPSYSIDRIQELLNNPSLPTGLHLSDAQQTWANFANAYSNNAYNQQTSHSGYGVYMFEPKAWIGLKRAQATKQYKSLSAADVPEEDCLPVLRVAVTPDTPSYVHGHWQLLCA